MPDDEMKSPSQGGVPASGGAPVTVTPSSGVLGAGTPSGTPGGGTPASPAGGSFASLNQYLAANQGQAAPLAGKLTSSIGKEYESQNAANTAALSNIGNQVTNAPGYTAGGSDVLAAEAANPVSFTKGAGNVQRFQSLLQNNYGGPASAESTPEFANRQSDINAAIAKGQSNTATEAGRENLISQNEAKPSTSTTALNSAILSQDPNALASVENAYKPFQNLLTGLQSGAQDVNKQIAQEQANAKASQQAAQNAVGSQITDLNKAVSGETATAQQAAAKQNAQLKANLAAGTLSDADLGALGMSRDQWNSLSAAQKAAATSQTVSSNQGQFKANTGTGNVDLTGFLTQTDPNAVINTANAATPEDYAKAKAFQTLLQGMNFAAPTAVINPATSGQAGTAPTNLSQYDYGTALNTAQGVKADETAAAQAYVDALQNGADEQHAQLAAQEAGRMKQEQTAELLSGVGAPLALASNLPVVGKPISKAVDTAFQELSSPTQVTKDVANGANTVVQAVTNATWICTAMRKAEVLSAEEINRLHEHLFKAKYQRPWGFVKYFVLGKLAALLANMAHVQWWYWKRYFYDEILEIKNPTEAVDAYEKAFWRLVKSACRRIYQEHFGAY